MSGGRKDKVRRWVRPEVGAIRAYHVPEAGRLIKLDAMENPYAWPQDMVEEWLAVLRRISVNRYPDAGAGSLSERLRESMAVPDDMALLLGNGSDEIIQIIALALAGSDRVLLAPEPGFVMYRMLSLFAGMRYVGVPLGADFSLDLPAMLEAVETHRPAVIFLAYPNNPTGNLFADRDIETIVKATDGLVVIDEAYHAFAQASWMDRMGRYDNVVVMRTVSKLGLAGLRLGFLAGPQEWLAEFDKLRLPYNVNVLTQASAEFALRHMDVFDEQTAAIRAAREAMFEALRRMPDVTPFPSAANFILFRVAPGRAARVFEGVKSRGVLIKNMGVQEGPLADCLRVTVGTPAENEAFLEALKESL